MGRAAEVDVLLTEDPNFPYASASPIKLRDRAETPRALTVEEIKEYVQLYVQAAKNAVGKAGFDGEPPLLDGVPENHAKICSDRRRDPLR